MKDETDSSSETVSDEALNWVDQIRRIVEANGGGLDFEMPERRAEKPREVFDAAWEEAV